ncbi:MAG: putative lipoprotein [Arenicella sp.]|jgi:uncharacterized lipoprotein
MISIKQQIEFKPSVLALLVTLMALSLSACSGGKKVITSDESADYKSARALPPLKKSSRVIVDQKSAVDRPDIDTNSVTEQADTPAPAAVISTEQTSVALGLSAAVVTTKAGRTRLEIAADFDRTWDYLNDSLQKSDLTVFSRNKEAGRFSIGCANIVAEPTVVKSGRWSFFNRGKQQDLEYCALEAVEKRGITVVSVLNQDGLEVSGEYSNTLFSRILNN